MLRWPRQRLLGAEARDQREPVTKHPAREDRKVKHAEDKHAVRYAAGGRCESRYDEAAVQGMIKQEQD